MRHYGEIRMNDLTIVMYHYTRDLVHSRYPGIKGLDVDLFRQQIAFFKERFSVVAMEQVLDCVERKYALPDNALLLTFDDGYIDNYTFAFPILEENHMQGSFFIPGNMPNPIGMMTVRQYLSSECCRQCCQRDYEIYCPVNCLKNMWEYPKNRWHMNCI